MATGTIVTVIGISRPPEDEAPIFAEGPAIGAISEQDEARLESDPSKGPR